MEFVAKFQRINGNLFRFDTRIYLGSFTKDSPSHCIGAIIGKNPGSAKPRTLDTLEPLQLDGDRMLPFVGNRFCAAFQQLGQTLPPNSFVRVWNLFYLCNANLKQAKSTFSTVPGEHFCPTESEEVPLSWFGWGGDDQKLNPFKARFLGRELRTPFFFNSRTRRVQATLPSATDPAQHTQGMPALPIETYLVEILR